ncbi:cysteine-rich CWC family protein [Teredinibacter sp. KSP-S5-2]|uniref:cysteine-rich CWC family protein n=1 Tax=Teredinibacter sp. KSP-S5-2 TaxID=3034506 RepID=UPI00293492B9|nr:cysteine-rich CWC family protein [Teredinibacter sp. KSP-S5-2]WNO11762.1 cysteine-rich CWC family protein [Teredinibacter sp. KSP-S5-2]
MPHHETVQCPRCKSQFECKVGSILICHCNEVKLSDGQKQYVAERWESCLCHGCLLDIQTNIGE